MGCGSSEGPDFGSDPQWGSGFSTRLDDAGDPDSPGTAAVACSLFGGPPYAYSSIADVTGAFGQQTMDRLSGQCES